MKHIFSIQSLSLVILICSCSVNRESQEQIRFECDSLLKLAASAYMADLRESAYGYCNKAIEKDSTYWLVYCHKGFYYWCDNNYDSAVVAYEKFYYLNDRHDTLPNSMYRLVNSYAKLKYYDRALTLAQEGLLSNPDNCNLMDEVSLCYASQEKYDMAEKWAMKALNTHKNDIQAYFRLAWINNKMGRMSKAIEYYEKLLELSPHDSAALYNLSILYWKTDRDKALNLRKNAAKLGDNYARKWCNEHGYDY